MKNHMWGMLVCCLLPLGVVLVGQAFGFNGNIGSFLIIPMMFLCIFMMLSGMKKDSNKENQKSCH